VANQKAALTAWRTIMPPDTLADFAPSCQDIGV